MTAIRVEAEYQDRKRIIFTARERTIANVRLEGPDGEPIGYNSYELLLIALANCTLGVVMGHASLADLPVSSCRAVLEADKGSSPARIADIRVRIELEVAGAPERLQQTLQRVADACPVGNTLRLSPAIGVQVIVSDPNARPASDTTPNSRPQPSAV